ncbi:MAG: hypothetical protein P8Y27_03755 [Chromatiaceae bacterium]
MQYAPLLHGSSARLALEGREADAAALLERSSFPELEAALVQIASLEERCAGAARQTK